MGKKYCDNDHKKSIEAKLYCYNCKTLYCDDCASGMDFECDCVKPSILEKIPL